MEVFKLVQVGDVHFPDEENAALAIDDHDPGFPDRVKSAVGIPPLQVAFQAVANLLETTNPDVLTFMGDYTSRGDSSQLERSLRYLREMVPDSWASRVAASSLLIIGNHDVDRRVDPEGSERWDLINAAVRSAGFPEAAVVSPSRVSWTGTEDGHVAVFGLNTCTGCGETRRLSPLIKAEVEAKLSSLLADAALSKADLEQIVDVIDTPAVSEDAVRELRELISAIPREYAIVVCGHHNLLPQATPRIAPYAELLNGGALRECLLSLDRPIIFLHGHLHTDPVEVIRSPRYRSGAIICIAAPIFRDGFNVLEIAFREGVPLGCKVVEYRRSGSQVDKRPPLVIPLWGTAEGLKLASSEGRALMQLLPADTATYQAMLKSEPAWPEETVGNAIDELGWLGMIEVLNPDSPKHLRRVMRAI